MTADFLAFRSPALLDPADPPDSRRPDPDPSYHSLSLLTRLRHTLLVAGGLVAECRKRHASTRGKWGVPPLFFFDRPGASAEPSFPEPYLSDLAPRMPAEALAWRTLPDLLDDALTLLPADVRVRRAARAVDGLAEAAAGVADVLPAAKELGELLAVPDDQVVLAVHPQGRFGVRVFVRGVADVNQLHVLLADELPGPRVDERIADAYRNARPHPDAGTFTARFQLFHPNALRPDGTLPRGFDGSDSWVWGDQSPAVLPLDSGERVVLMGEPAYRQSWEVRRKFPRLSGGVEVVERLTAADVTRWLAKRCPDLPATVRERVAA